MRTRRNNHSTSNFSTLFNSRSDGILVALLLAACSLFPGCANSKQPVVEKPPSPNLQAATAAPIVQLVPNLTPPKLIEVQDAVRRVFGDAATLDQNHRPNFVAGDFNGDMSQDIAVVLRVAPGKLAQMNEDYPRWILKDASAPIGARTRLPHVEENDVLMAVIHGYGANDWRNPEATQTYLLRNAVGSGIEVRTAKEVAAEYRGQKLPKLHGDVIAEVLRGTSGCLYYAGSTYAWYDPNSFRGDPETGMFHRGAAMRK